MKCDLCHENESCRIFYQSGYEPDTVYLCEVCYQNLMNEMYPDSVKAMEMLEMEMDHEEEEENGDYICSACDGTGIDETGETCKYFDLEEREKCINGIVRRA